MVNSISHTHMGITCGGEIVREIRVHQLTELIPLSTNEPTIINRMHTRSSL